MGLLNPLPLKPVIPKVTATTPVTPKPLNAQQTAFNNAGEAAKNAGQSSTQQLLAGQTAASGVAPVADAIIPNYTPNYGQPPTQTPPSTSTLTAPNPPPMTAYQTMLQQRLAGNDPNIVNAQAQQNTNKSMNDYMAMKTAGQTNVQSGFAPGSLQSQRVIDRGQAGAAQQDLAGQNSVNSLTASENQENLTASNTVDQQNYQKGQDLATSISDPQARAAFLAALASGQDYQTAYSNIMNSDGTVKSGYQSPDSPLTPAQLQQNQTTFQNNMNSGNYSGNDWTSDAGKQVLGAAPQFNQGAVDAAGGPDTYAASLSGKLISLNGKPVTVQQNVELRTGGDSTDGYTHDNFIQGIDQMTGKPIWFDSKTGQSTTTAPPTGNNPAANKQWLKTFDFSSQSNN